MRHRERRATVGPETSITLDQLAHQLKIDPIELRRINEPEKDPTTKAEFSSRNLVEAYARGAQRFGWSERNPQPRSQLFQWHTPVGRVTRDEPG